MRADRGVPLTGRWTAVSTGVPVTSHRARFPPAWHEITTDRLFVADGLLKIVLYDAREGATTYGRINEFRLGALRPGLLVVPPGVWHGVQNIGPDSGRLLNLVDCAYRYDDPDHWKLPPDTDRIPYSFSVPPSV